MSTIKVKFKTIYIYCKLVSKNWVFIFPKSLKIAGINFAVKSKSYHTLIECLSLVLVSPLGIITALAKSISAMAKIF